MRRRRRRFLSFLFDGDVFRGLRLRSPRAQAHGRREADGVRPSRRAGARRRVGRRAGVAPSATVAEGFGRYGGERPPRPRSGADGALPTSKRASRRVELLLRLVRRRAQVPIPSPAVLPKALPRQRRQRPEVSVPIPVVQRQALPRQRRQRLELRRVHLPRVQTTSSSASASASAAALGRWTAPRKARRR